jgi:cytochrome c553
MKSVAESLDDEQVAALAAYFGSLDRPPKKK